MRVNQINLESIDSILLTPLLVFCNKNFDKLNISNITPAPKIEKEELESESQTKSSEIEPKTAQTVKKTDPEWGHIGPEIEPSAGVALK